MGFLRWSCFCIIAATNWVGAVPISPPTSLLVDQVGVLRDAERAALLARLQTIQASGRAQIEILISSGTEGAPLADYALQVAESWQLGRAGHDDGLLILVVPSPAAVRLEVGYGLEGVIPDARASQWTDDLLPAVKNDELAQGLDRLLSRIEGVLPEKESVAKPDERYLFPDHPEWRLPFAVITLFVGAGLSAAEMAVWPAPVFAGLLAIGVAVFLFPGKAADGLMIVLRSAMHFVFILVVAYIALLPFGTDPLPIALAAAAAVTACAALGLYLDSRERARGSAARGEVRWSLWFLGLALLLALPFGVLALFLSIGGEDFQMQLAQAAAGGGSIAGILALAARYGLFAAVPIGLGGRFGGGGAGRGE